MSDGRCYCDQCEGLSVPPGPEPCWAIVRDTERMTTYCALVEGHAGQCSETPINGGT